MRFALTAVDRTNRAIALDLDADDESSAREVAKARGYAVLAIRRSRVIALPAAEAAFPTTLFSIELLALLDAGLNVVEALQALAEKEAKTKQREVVSSLLGALQRGESLSQAVQAFPHCFPPLYVATIRSSERTGDLRQALARYVAYREEFDRVRKKLTAALVYPAILAVIGTLVLCFLLFYVVPRFARVYEEAAIDLPVFSSLLLTIGSWIDHHALVTAGLIVVMVSAAAYALSRPALRAALLDELYRRSALGERVRTYQLGRLYRTVAMLLQAGIPAVQAFEMASGLLPSNLRLKLLDAISGVTEGKSISAALAAAGLATPVTHRLLAVGERGGQMGAIMDRAARFCDDETARFVDAFTRVFEPLLMALLGLAVGAVVVLMYMPIFELAGSIR